MWRNMVPLAKYGSLLYIFLEKVNNGVESQPVELRNTFPTSMFISCLKHNIINPMINMVTSYK